MSKSDDRFQVDQPDAETPSVWTYLGKWLVVSVLVLVVLVIAESLWVESGERDNPMPPPGLETQKSFNSYAEFIESQQSQGFVFLGRFDDRWPAEIIEERTAMNEISFRRGDGTKHTYPKYDGYELKVVRLRTDQNTEAVVVLRSKEKRWAKHQTASNRSSAPSSVASRSACCRPSNSSA